MAARERALRQAEDRMAKAHERLVVWFSTNRKAVLEDLAYLEEKGRYQELHDRAGLFESLNDSEVQRYRQKAAENLQQVVSANATVAGPGTAVANPGEAGRAGTTPGTAGHNDRKPSAEDAVSLARAEMATAVAKGKGRIREQLKSLKRWPCAGPTQAAMTWYHDSEGVRCSTGTGFFLLLGMQDGQKPVLMLRVQYDGAECPAHPQFRGRDHPDGGGAGRHRCRVRRAGQRGVVGQTGGQARGQAGAGHHRPEQEQAADRWPEGHDRA